MTRQDVFAACRSGVAQICLEQGRDRLTAGTGFRVHGGLVTNSHVLRDATFDVAAIRFEDTTGANVIRLSRETLIGAVEHESDCNEHDVAFIRFDEPELEGRYKFEFGDSNGLRVGQEVGFLGYPFQMDQLTCHVGYVSSLHRNGGVDVIQVDGSINGGNSGGPLIDLSNGLVVGVVTRAHIGFLADQFDELICTLNSNIELLQSSGRPAVMIGGVDPVKGLLASQSAMRQIAVNLRKSANVGIGYAFSSNYIRDQLV